MNPLRSFLLPAGLLVGILCNSVSAAYLDFTDDSLSLSSITDGYSGSIDGVGFTLTSTNPAVVKLDSDGGYDGSSSAPCQAGGPLKCDKDGVGINNDEISGLNESSGQILTLEFATAVSISSFDFLDLYRNPGAGSQAREQARVTIDGGTPYTRDALGISGDGGYARLDLLAYGGPVLGKKIEFTAFQGTNLQDDADNDYALAALTVSAVPVPAAVWLFGTALAGLIGFSKRRKAA